MKIKRLLFFSIAIIAMVYTSCRHEADLSNAPVISFSNDVQPIITTRCAMDGCHSAYSHEKLSLETYEEVMKIVKAGKIHSSDLYETITALNGEKRMPPLPDSRLADKQILKIMIWIEQGAKNN